jgi:predicted PurR-regulated permease PerM
VLDKDLKLPFYAKAAILLIGLFALLIILYVAQGIIVPFIFAIIIAILLNPIVNFFTKLKINRLFAIIITLFLTFLIFAGFGLLFISQLDRFGESWPLLVEKFNGLINQIITEGSNFYGYDPQKIHEWITKSLSELLNTSTAIIGKTLVTLGSALIILFLIPVYVFMILFYQPILVEFIHKLFGIVHKKEVTEIVSETKTVVQRYLFGLVIETIIVAILDASALFILGIEYAILIGIIGALLNLIPYIGGLVAVAIPMMVALVTKTSPIYAIYVLIAYYIIQLIDNNYIVPKIVASKVKINALFSILAVIAGNALWGIPGMFLSIPLLAIIKLICDRIEPLKPWGFLLGDTMPPILKIKPLLQKIKDKQYHVIGRKKTR